MRLPLPLQVPRGLVSSTLEPVAALEVWDMGERNSP